MRKKVLAALLVAAVAGTTVMSGMTAFAAETEGTKAKAKYYHCRNSRSAEHQSALCCGSDKLRYDAGTVQPVF